MSAQARRVDDPSSPNHLLPNAPIAFPEHVAQALWHGTDLGSASSGVTPTGFAALDAELPGGGWPCHSLTDVLQVQPSLCEWRLVAPAMGDIVKSGQSIAVIGPPKWPHLPGLRYAGIDERHLVWIQAEVPAERLWVTEQLIKSNACGAILSWLPLARPDQVRRLQVCAHGCDAPVFLFRPESAAQDASAASLRVKVEFCTDWELAVRVLKRKGPPLEEVLRLPSIPGGLESVIAPRVRVPSRILLSREATHALGRVPAELPVRSISVH